jgi:predicted N-acetyltransferase YhbS
MQDVVTQIQPYTPAMAGDLQALWQEAVGSVHPLTALQWSELLENDPGFRLEDLLVAVVGNKPAGFVLTKQLREDFPAMAERGWIALLAVAPTHQRKGIGARLLAAAEAHLGKRIITLGDSFHHALPGIPAELSGARAFFAKHGYVETQQVWDVRGDAREGGDVNLPEGVTVRPLQPGEEGELLHFLNTTFPGRWARDMAQSLVEHEPIADVMGLIEHDTLIGFSRIAPPGSRGAARWAGFSAGIAGLGPIGVSDEVRGRGLGLALVRAGLAELARRGATDTVIDWTTLLDFYGRVGFKPWLCYQQARKELA